MDVSRVMGMHEGRWWEESATHANNLEIHFGYEKTLDA